MKTSILSNVSKNTALSYISKIPMKGDGDRYPAHYKTRNPYKIPNTPYIDKMMSTNQLICYKCLNPITIGTEYTFKSKKCRVTKYYHNTCFQEMLQ